MKLFNEFFNLIFPPKCPFCRQIVEKQGICDACRKDLPWTEGTEVRCTVPGGYECTAPLFYEDMVRETLLRLKFHGAAYLAEPLGQLIAQCAAEELSGEFDRVTWVPVGPKRLKKRGYDQAQLLAEGACRVWETAPERLLVKTEDNPAQSGLSDAAARRANVLGMYDLAPRADITGRRILLIDDICTTGSTLAECARTLLCAGAENVVCAAVAVTRGHDRIQKELQ